MSDIQETCEFARVVAESDTKWQNQTLSGIMKLEVTQ